MADKEATVYILDVGKSMGEKHNGRDESDLDWSMPYLWEKIMHTVSTGRKTALIGVLGLRTDDSKHPPCTKDSLGHDEAYQNISEFQPLQQTQLVDVQNLRKLIRPSHTDDGDAISAFIVAAEMIRNKCKKLKYIRRIVLVTNASGTIDADDNEAIEKLILQENMEVTIMVVDGDDPKFGIIEKGKDPSKKVNEKTLQTLATNCNGIFMTMARAIASLDKPILKSVRPRTNYKGLLTLGDHQHDEYGQNALCIKVERYPRVMISRPPTASKFVVKSDYTAESAGQASTQSTATVKNGQTGEANSSGFAGVSSARAFQIDDPLAPGGKRDVPTAEVEKGYEYGRSAVPISESDENIVKLETEAALSIVGFVPADKFERYFAMSKSSIIIGSQEEPKESMAMSSFIHALIDLDVYAIARFVERENKSPHIVLLAPSIEDNFEYLIDVELPFAEDVRSFKFPPLDKVITVVGKNLIQHRNLPNDQLMKAMSDYVDSMDLSTFGEDEEGEPVEYGPPNETFNPVLHRIQQAIRHRAIYSTDNLPPPNNITTKYSTPPRTLLEKSQPALNTVIKASDVKKVPPKQKGRKRTREHDKPLSGLDIDALLGSSANKRLKISAENAIPEFKQLLATTDDMGVIRDAAKQMGKIIQGYIRDSVGDMGYEKAVEALRVMRDELVDLEEPEIFNEFIKGLKGRILKQELKGDRTEMWYLIKNRKLGLVDDKTSEVSDITEDKAKEFYSIQQ